MLTIEQVKDQPSSVTEEVCADPAIARFEHYQGFSDISEPVIEWLNAGQDWDVEMATTRYDFDEGKAAELKALLQKKYPHYSGIFSQVA
jgi:hypothetical protein